MHTLVIETATERSIVAIMDAQNCLYFTGLPLGLHNSKFLLPKIEEGFREINKTPQDMDLIVVGNGPGSYTGIRVGAAIAKTFSYTCKTPLIGVGTLEAFIPDHDGIFCSIIDAKLSGFYVLKGIRKSGKTAFAGEPQICSLENLEGFLQGIEVLVTPNMPAVREKVGRHYPSNKWEWQETAPDPLAMLNRARELFDQGQYSLDGKLDILYLK